MSVSPPEHLSNARISFVTLGVNNLAAATQFYEKLGWVNSASSQESISFLIGSNIVLGLYGRQDLADDIGLKNTSPEFGGMALAINMATTDDVDNFIKTAQTAGGIIVKAPEKVFWGGYSGYFSDLDGHHWEVAHNPFFKFDANGNLDLQGDSST